MKIPQTFIDKATRNLNLRDFSLPNDPIAIMEGKDVPDTNEQYILRMMVRSNVLPLTIPPELKWLESTIHQLDDIQKANSLHNPFIYVTVRHGIVKSTTDDLWHVDGFSLRMPHVPEQNYIYVNVEPTEYLSTCWKMPETFDGMKHNIHWYFQDHAKQEDIRIAKAGTFYLIDPYCVHRRPVLTNGIMRTFVRISFIPIEIEDDTCMRNPLFPEKVYGREDIRNKLVKHV